MEAKLNNTYLFKKFTLSADIQTNDLFAVGGRGYGPLQQGVFHGYPLKSPKAPGGTFDSFDQTHKSCSAQFYHALKRNIY